MKKKLTMMINGVWHLMIKQQLSPTLAALHSARMGILSAASVKQKGKDGKTKTFLLLHRRRKTKNNRNKTGQLPRTSLLEATPMPKHWVSKNGLSNRIKIYKNEGAMTLMSRTRRKSFDLEDVKRQSRFKTLYSDKTISLSTQDVKRLSFLTDCKILHEQQLAVIEKLESEEDENH